jgi:small subunit ribosomal protein S6
LKFQEIRKFENRPFKEMHEVTELAENNAALEAEEISEETNDSAENGAEESVSAEVGSTPDAQADGADDAEAAPAADAPESSAPSRDADGFSAGLPETENAQRKHVPGGIGYELIYTVPSGDQQLVDDSSQRVRDVIEGVCEGAVDNVRASEVRRFAYPIKKQTEGVYVVVNARFKPEHTGELDRHFKLDESVLRHMLLKEDN